VKPAFSAVLVNYNSGGELRRALESIDRESAGPWEGVVVDNASTDGSERTAVAFESTQLLRNRENVGFGRGVNQGVAACTADRILIMNPDCQLATGALPPLMAVLDADPRCAIAAPRILDPDGSASRERARRPRHAHRPVRPHEHAASVALRARRCPPQRDYCRRPH
jgi:GT2 family glycosyltransferase